MNDTRCREIAKKLAEEFNLTAPEWVTMFTTMAIASKDLENSELIPTIAILHQQENGLEGSEAAFNLFKIAGLRAYNERADERLAELKASIASMKADIAAATTADATQIVPTVPTPAKTSFWKRLFSK